MFSYYIRKSILIIFALLFTSTNCFAFGDWDRGIGDGYRIVRANSLDVCLDHDGSGLIIPRTYDGVGPIVMFSNTEELILTKNNGSKNRNKWEGDSFKIADPSKELFFIVIKKNDQVIGPLSRSAFEKHELVSKLGKIKWKPPRRPFFSLATLEVCIFFIMHLILLAIRYFWISIPVILCIMWALYRAGYRAGKKKLEEINHLDPNSGD